MFAPLLYRKPQTVNGKPMTMFCHNSYGRRTALLRVRAYGRLCKKEAATLIICRSNGNRHSLALPESQENFNHLGEK